MTFHDNMETILFIHLKLGSFLFKIFNTLKKINLFYNINLLTLLPYLNDTDITGI